MAETGWETTIKDLRQQLASIKNQALATSARFEELRRQAEFIKIQFLVYQLDTRRKFLARSRGAAYIAEPRKSLPLLGVSAAISILTGMITKDRDAAMNVGIRGLNGALQGLGETDWAVSLGNNLEIAPLDNVGQGKDWVTWDSLKIAMRELELRAKNDALGNLDNIISELRKSKSLVFVNKASTDGTTV